MSNAEDGTVYVDQLSPEFDVSSFNDFKVRSYDELLKSAATDEKKLPDPAVRNQLFNDAGIGPEVQAWDEFEKDSLYARALSQPLARLETQYPKLAKIKLEDLQKRIRENAK